MQNLRKQVRTLQRGLDEANKRADSAETMLAEERKRVGVLEGQLLSSERGGIGHVDVTAKAATRAATALRSASKRLAALKIEMEGPNHLL